MTNDNQNKPQANPVMEALFFSGIVGLLVGLGIGLLL